MPLLELTIAMAIAALDGSQGATPVASTKVNLQAAERADASSSRTRREARPRATPRAAPRTWTDRARARVVAVARSHVGKPFSGDCSGFVRAVFRRARVPLPAHRSHAASGSEAIFRSLSSVRRPHPGDVVVFHRTYDRERPGPGRNLFTHVGVVESVRGSRVTFIHRIGGRVERSTMNLSRPSDPRENDPLRRPRVADRPAQRYLAGELFAGYASAMGGELRVARAVQRDQRARAGSSEGPPARGETRRPAPPRPRRR